ncbi:NAD(P)-dependent dehydrogenase (short-subunit alcohol dehydrogenase family) [Pseudorhizobium tarimense]|uniref:NAD(P)-dependent dehydrogenase (Short-subunit alcohol dehydrogenase family) n=1 Tax=Pseudorhizobium tarimense TaxID=1079109 RepID=A0ABV2H7P2_9HYPH|nr:SDR family oxidoreductase [Pseudorhizobium tarimense]MCJ8519425.1 SDR family oxidoreductase [Pseudorhizobium tarimense]
MTGGAGLIGTELCRALSEQGFEVASFDVEQGPEGVRQIHCDVGDETSVTGAFEELGWDTLDLLVNNSGIAGPTNGPIADLSLEDWRKVTDSHLTGAFLMTRSAVPLMGEGASIVNMASTRAFMSEPETEAYAASKGGLVALTHALAVSLGPKIRVNAIAPGWISGQDDLRPVDHEQHPVGRVGRPRDVADAVLYLASAGFITGQVVVLDGGMTRRMIYEE